MIWILKNKIKILNLEDYKTYKIDLKYMIE